MLSEKQIVERWQKLFRSSEQYEEDAVTAEKLIDQIGEFSPLRHRLTRDLDEITARNAVDIEQQN